MYEYHTCNIPLEGEEKEEGITQPLPLVQYNDKFTQVYSYYFKTGQSFFSYNSNAEAAQFIWPGLDIDSGTDFSLSFSLVGFVFCSDGVVISFLEDNYHIQWPQRLYHDDRFHLTADRPDEFNSFGLQLSLTSAAGCCLMLMTP